MSTNDARGGMAEFFRRLKPMPVLSLLSITRPGVNGRRQSGGAGAWLLAVSLLAIPLDGAEPKASIKTVEQIEGLPSRIAFGSCSNQEKPQPILRTVVSERPDLFIYLGDNIYGDTQDMNELRAKYAMLGAKPEFQALRRNVPLLSIWDDHDYGENDAGKEYPMKEPSREIFFDFWSVPPSSPRRRHTGIYGAHRFEKGGRILQIILLDTRTFRDPLKKNPDPLPPNYAFKNSYQPDPDSSKTLLGSEQWDWLEARLREPADVRIIATSIQFGHEYNGWESWTNLPSEQERMISLIRKTRANGVLFISGDVHWAEISARPVPGGYPLYDVTASGLTEDWDTIEPNRYRVGGAVRENHFGLIEINWKDRELALKVIDLTGTTRLSHNVKLAGLAFP